MNFCVTSGIIKRCDNDKKTTFPETLAFLKDAVFEEMDPSFDTPDLLRGGWENAFRGKFM